MVNLIALAFCVEFWLGVMAVCFELNGIAKAISANKGGVDGLVGPAAEHDAASKT